MNSLTLTARPGQFLIVWATGLGAGLNADNVQPQVGDLPVAVEISGVLDARSPSIDRRFVVLCMGLGVARFVSF